MSAGLKITLLFIAALVAQQSPTTPPRGDGTIAGQVVDASTGKPVGAVFVTLVGPVSVPQPSTFAVLTTSDSRFVFRALAAGEYGIAAMKQGYSQGLFNQVRPEGTGQPIRVESDRSLTDVTLRVWKQAAITGTVVDEAGEPVVGVHVRAFRRRSIAGRFEIAGAALAETDDRGAYRLSGLRPGEYLVMAGARQIAVPPAWAQRATASIRQPPGSPGTASAIEVGGSVYAIGRGSAVPPAPRSGSLVIYPLIFHPSAVTPGTATPVSLASGEERSGIDILLQPTPTARVSGKVTWQGQAAAGEALRLLPGGRGEWLGGIEEPVTVTGPDGEFTFPAVPSGLYRLRNDPGVPSVSRSQPLENTRWSEIPVVVGDADVEDLAVILRPSLRITGRMEFDGTARQPTVDRLLGLSIDVEHADAETLLRLPTPRPRVQEDGGFTIIGLKPGRYYVRQSGPPEGWVLRSAMHQGRDLSIVPIEITGEDVSGVMLQFTDRISRLSGTVTSRDGQPEPGAAVLLFPTDAKRWTDAGTLPPGFARSRANPAGRYVIGPLPAGSYYVAAIPDEQVEDWRDPALLERLARLATLVTIVEGDQRAQNLQTVDVR